MSFYLNQKDNKYIIISFPRIYDGILKEEVTFKNIYPPLKPDLIDLIIKLLNKDPLTRLGSQQGFKEIKNHPYFKLTNWMSLLKKETHAPFIPSQKTVIEI